MNDRLSGRLPPAAIGDRQSMISEIRAAIADAIAGIGPDRPVVIKKLTVNINIANGGGATINVRD